VASDQAVPLITVKSDAGARTRWYQPRPVGIKIGIINGTWLVWFDSWAAMLISNLLEATPGIEPGIAVLQTAALPLG